MESDILICPECKEKYPKNAKTNFCMEDGKKLLPLHDNLESFGEEATSDKQRLVGMDIDESSLDEDSETNTSTHEKHNVKVETSFGKVQSIDAGNAHHTFNFPSLVSSPTQGHELPKEDLSTEMELDEQTKDGKKNIRTSNFVIKIESDSDSAMENQDRSVIIIEDEKLINNGLKTLKEVAKAAPQSISNSGYNALESSPDPGSKRKDQTPSASPSQHKESLFPNEQDSSTNSSCESSSEVEVIEVKEEKPLIKSKITDEHLNESTRPLKEERSVPENAKLEINETEHNTSVSNKLTNTGKSKPGYTNSTESSKAKEISNKDHEQKNSTKSEQKIVGHQHQFPVQNKQSSQQYCVKFAKFSSNELCDVEFYAAIPSGMKARVFLQGGFRRDNQWNGMLTEMKPFEKKETLGLDLLYGKVQIPCYILKRKIAYKYCLLPEDGEKIVYEDIETTFPAPYRNRLFEVTFDDVQGGHVVQFDDVILLPESMNLIERGKNWLKGMVGLSNNKRPPLKRQDYNGKLFLYHFNNIFRRENKERKMKLLNHLSRCFLDSKTELRGYSTEWEKIDVNNKQLEVVMVAIAKILTKNVKILVPTSSDMDQIDSLMESMSFVAFISNILEKHKKFIKTDHVLILMEGLSMEHLPLQSYQLFLQRLKDGYDRKPLKVVLERLIFIWKTFMSYPKVSTSIVWLYPLVLMHELDKLLETGLNKYDLKDTGELSLEYCGLFGLHECYLPSGSNNSRELDSFFNGIKHVAGSIKKDTILQRALVYMMEPKHLTIGFQFGFKRRMVLRKTLSFVKKFSFSDEPEVCAAIIALDKQIQDVDHKDLCHLVVLLLEFLATMISKSYFLQLTSIVLETTLNALEKIQEFFDDLESSFLHSFQNRVSEKEPMLLKSLHEFTTSFALRLKTLDDVEHFLNILYHLEKVTLFNSGFAEKWRNKLHKKTTEMLDDLCRYKEKIFLEIYLGTKLEGFILQNFDEAFEKNIDRFMTVGILESTLSHRRTSIFLGKKIKDLWEKHNTDKDRFEWMMGWNPFKVVFKHYWYGNDKSLEGIMETCSNIILNHCHELNDRNVTIKNLKSIKQYRERFFQILDIVVESVDSVNEIKANFEQRSKEMEAYKEAFNVMSYLNEFLLKLSEQIGDLRIFRNKMQTNADSLKLIDIYKKGTNSISYFDVDPGAKPLLKLFLKSDMASSVIFQQLWKSTLIAAASKERKLGFESQFTDVNEKALFQMSFKLLLAGITIPESFSLPFNLKQIILYLLLPTLNQTYDLLVDLCGGSISIGEALKYYEQFQSATSFAKELTQLKTFFEADVTETSIKKCHQRIKCADTMKDCVEQSNAILETASVLGLCGNFKSVELIKAKATANEDTLLNAITDDLIKDTKKVINTSDEMKQIFKAVAHNLNILQWLKRHLKDAKEVKVFVEMMSIAAGESDYEVDRVAYFEASCQAFSAIIFDLDQNSGYEQFEEACKRAAEAVKNDPTIIEKLNDSNKNLEWFKQAKESQGSVSARSFLEAKKANSNGKYIIGNLTGKADFFFGQTAALHHVVKLKIVYEDDQVQSKELSLDDVHDLQSRLMLLGRDNNKTEENIKEGIVEKEYFVKQAEIITRLADAYVRLIEAGDIQYLNWKKEYQCNVEEAKQRTFEEYFREIEIEIEKFERRLESWNVELMQFRMENPYANHFSVKQILVLRKYLKQYSSSSTKPEINNQVFTLLRSISEEVTVKKVKECCLFMHSSASKSPIKNDKKKLEDNETNFTRFTYKELDALIQKFLNENDDIEKDVVFASLMQVPDFRSEKKVILWCGKHEDDEDLIEELSEKAEAELVKMKETIYLSSDGEDCEMEIIDDLEKDYLPLDLFGNFLNQFGTITHHRSIPTYLQKHQPNLIILPRDEILASVIAMYDNDGSASLPSSSEVLLCSDDVSLEQVEMLIIRAALTEDGMFCLAFAEHLNYENSEKVFGFLQKIMKEKNMGYLVVICSSEEENQSYLASALDSYQRQCVHRKRDISSILSKAFCLKEEIEHNKKVMYGPTVDEDRYNVRVVSSTRGGMGKSLMIDRKCHQLDKYIVNSATTIQKERFQRYQTLVRTPVHGTAVCYEDVVSKLAENSIFDADFPRIYHFDVAPTVHEGLDILFFNVFVLGSMQTKTGKVWRKNNNDMCYVEMTKISSKTKDGKSSAGVMLQNLPHTECASPEEALRIRRGQPAKMVFEESELRSSQFQRVFQYLQRYEANPKSLNDFDYEHSKNIQVNVVGVLEVLLRYCGIPDPSWMELRNFVHFFNQNLLDCERSVFTSVYLRADFPGLRTFVVTFLLEMARV